MGVAFDHCLFCMTGKPVTAFGGRRTFDYTGVPDIFAKMFRRAVATHYPACAECATLIRAKDQIGLRERALKLHMHEKFISADDERRRVTLLTNAELWQTVFWLGLATEFGPVIRLATLVPPATRFVFDLVSAAGGDRPYPSFRNGVDVYGWPLTDTSFVIEDFRSRNRRAGHAGRVLDLMVALADVHDVTLRGVVEAHPVDGVNPGLTDDELRGWYARYGFEPDTEVVRGVSRAPRSDVAPEQRLNAVETARAALHQ